MASGPSVVIITSLWAAPLSTFCSGFGFKLVWPSSDLPHQVWSGQRWNIPLISSKACIKHRVVAFAKKQTLSNLKKCRHEKESTSRALMNSDFPFSALSFRLHRLHPSMHPCVFTLAVSVFGLHEDNPMLSRPSETSHQQLSGQRWYKKDLYFKFKPCKTHLQRRGSYHVVLVWGYTSIRVTRGWG